MGLNKSTGDMYRFIDFTWNAVKGQCPHGCSYCYMKRWGKQPQLHFDERELRTDFGVGRTIFIGSSCDLFAEGVPDEWIERIKEKCRTNPGNIYFFQSKNPERMIRMLSGADFSVRICTTIETNRSCEEIAPGAPSVGARADSFRSCPPGIEKYVTIEPVLDFDTVPFAEMIRCCGPVQVNIGADSGHNSLPEPDAEKIRALAALLSEFTRVNMKENLLRIMKNK
jgi:DNA repair photolyase